VTTPAPSITQGVVGSKDGTAISWATLGAGEGLLVLGGAWRTSRDYLPFARALSDAFTVHVIDRRGRGRSGPQGIGYGIAQEIDDLLAVQAQTGAKIAFGHSYGGLVALEAARRSDVLRDVIVYEPAVSVAGSLPLAWMDVYRERLAGGDSRGGFAAMVRGAGGAPPALERMPLAYVKLMLRLFIRQEQWRQIEPLLQTGLTEHEQVAALDDSTVDRYHAIAARVLLLGEAKSRAFATTELFDRLAATIPSCARKLIDGLDHTAPDEKAPESVAEHVLRHLRG
jgi:pimeloyl-ACP methyl ester carboxylesterase